MTGPTFEALLDGRAPPAAGERLALYGELLEKWSARHNLVRFSSRAELVNRHLLESTAAAETMGSAGTLVDIGSGAGLPGVPLLCMRPGWSGILVEPRQKRWAFLKLVIRELDLAARAEAVRYEALDVAEVDLVTARAIGGHAKLLEWARSRLTAAGRVVIWGTDEEEARLGRIAGWHVLSSPLIGLDRGRLIQLQVCST